MFSRTPADVWLQKPQYATLLDTQQPHMYGTGKPASAKPKQLDPLFARLPVPAQQHNNGLPYHKTLSHARPLPAHKAKVSLPPLASL
ncbi:hypothetical protein HK096_001895, partial [Nowakowskiella sp. JEL0078]